MRGLSWLNRDQMASWAAEPTRVFDEVVGEVEEVIDVGGGQVE